MIDSYESALQTKIDYIKSSLRTEKEKLAELESLQEQLNKLNKLISYCLDYGQILEINISSQSSKGESVRVPLSNYKNLVEKLLKEIHGDLTEKI